jgi:CSLREA domain-containing protein
MASIGALFILGMVMAAALRLSPPVAHAASITVDSTADTLGGSDCTLRAAIQAASTDTAVDDCTAGDPGADTITFASGLTGTITLSNTLEITSSMTIQGPGAEDLAISGDNTVRVFFISDESAVVRLEGLTIRDGYTEELDETGGGIGNVATLVLDQMLIEHSESRYGGGISNDGTLTISNSTIRNNKAGPTINPAGGGIYNDDNGTLTIYASTINDNTAISGFAVHGGGIANRSTNAVIIRESVLSGNNAEEGSGGGIFHFGTGAFTITTSTISGNVGLSGGGILTRGPMYVDSTTISGNTGYAGGGMAVGDGGALEMVNSTVTSNTVSHEGGGFHLHHDSSVLIDSSTIVSNTAEYAGGGLHMSQAIPSIKQSIIAYNTAGSVGGRPDCGNTFNSLGYNLIGDTTDCNIQGDTNTNLTNMDPLLGPLADNGGLTQTHLPLDGSPAIDAVLGGCDEATDQRGIPRPQNDTCDIGAVEVEVIFDVWLPILVK